MWKICGSKISNTHYDYLPRFYQGSYPFFGLRIQGLFKDFQGHIFHFSRTPRTLQNQ